MDNKLIVKRYGGGFTVGTANRPAIYGESEGTAIRKFADANYSKETSTFKALMWYGHLVSLGYHHYEAPNAWDRNLREITNAWFRKTQM